MDRTGHDRLAEVPRHTTTERPWRSALRGPRADRMTTSVTASVPPRIAELVVAPLPDDLALLDRAADALRTLDDDHGARLAPLAGLLARTEAVASSRIEDELADLDDYARAVVGIRANTSATLMVAATAAVRRLSADAGRGAITERSILAAHHELMRDDPVDGRAAGSYRTVQNWIGGGSTPRLATYVPPPPELVSDAMADLLAFLARDDVHPIAQAAIAHAQFESIHPFTDGNGRIGRALMGAVFRRRGLTTTLTAPVATALVADRARYFDHLVRYRFGSVHDFVADLAIAVGTACDEASVTALLLGEHTSDDGGDGLLDDPVLTEDRALELAAAAGVTTDDHVDRLIRAGVIRPVTTRRRNRAWLVTGVATELDAFAERVRAAVLRGEPYGDAA
ncbi:Fic family protein [Curtobacterium sp. PhB130]|nr:Fic family protein [Curtobacterium sp. PhB130]